MIQVPLQPGVHKIGECGRIDWFRSGKFLQFQNSFWMNDKLHLKPKIETQLLMVREGVQLNRSYRKVRLASLVLIFALMVYIAYIILLDPYDTYGKPDQNYSKNIWTGYWIFFIVCVVVVAFQIGMVRRMIHSVKMAIQALNNKLKLERVNAYLILKEENCCQKYWGQLWYRMNFVQVFQYVTY